MWETLNLKECTDQSQCEALKQYSFSFQLKQKTILVFDFGGGTLDVSIVKCHNMKFEVKATAGESHLGGENLDTRMVDHFVEEFKKKYNRDLRTSKRALNRLRMACERAKRNLSYLTRVSIEIDSLFEGIDFQSTISRARFVHLNEDLFLETLKPVERALNDANMRKEDIDDILLVGGSTHIPRIQTLLQELFGGKELTKSINPEEAVAYGAALQAAVLHGDVSDEIKDLVLLDVTPFSLGLETRGGVMIVFIKRNTVIPTKEQKFFSTYADNQSTVEIKVYEGERSFTRDNNLLGTFELTDIPPAPRGEPKFEVTFDIDKNGILNVEAVETSSGIANKITICNDRDHLTKEDIDRLVAEAEAFKARDERQREIIEAKNSLENICLNFKTTVENIPESNISDNDRSTIVEKCDNILLWIEMEEFGEKHEFDEKRKELEKMFERICIESDDDK